MDPAGAHACGHDAAGGRAGGSRTGAGQVLDPGLEVDAAASGLSQPISMVFLDRDDMLVLEKASGQVKRIVDGQVRRVVLDLAVNSASERGLLGIALHPKFRRNGWVYLFWSQSRSGADSDSLTDVRLMGNRIDRFEWKDGRLEFDRNIIKFRALQLDDTNRDPAPARWCRVATTMAVSSASGPTASCTRSSGTLVAAVTRRICSMDRSGPALTTTSSAVRRPTTRIARV